MLTRRRRHRRRPTGHWWGSSGEARAGRGSPGRLGVGRVDPRTGPGRPSAGRSMFRRGSPRKDSVADVSVAVAVSPSSTATWPSRPGSVTGLSSISTRVVRSMLCGAPSSRCAQAICGLPRARSSTPRVPPRMTWSRESRRSPWSRWTRGAARSPGSFSSSTRHRWTRMSLAGHRPARKPAERRPSARRDGVRDDATLVLGAANSVGGQQKASQPRGALIRW
ncbi:MAG: hypothetical protein JWQ81_4778 [Amycolatopsis sp.]|nr:hypothetical protein [Amycolatopsis sp.]